MSVDFGNPKLTPWQEYAENESNKFKKNNVILQEKDFLEAAQKEGLLHTLTEDDFISNGSTFSNKKPLYPGDAYLLLLSCKRLRDVCLIDICKKLTICNLSNNFLQDIKPIRWCVNLICLDLHSNQINHLPKHDFWRSLPKLTTLYMHDNGIFKLEELKYLSCSPTLYNLTLHDTPISLKKNYRHCVVNAIWTLKALDQCVVSDEEVIEDADFPFQFKSMHSRFFFNSSYLAAKQVQSYSKTLLLINKDMSTINAIQSRWCPVLVIQRYIRGFLVRLRYNYVMDTRLWAAVSIQRFYRSFKGYPNPPPSTPITQQQQDSLIYQSLSSLKLDYETYLKLRRSRHKSFIPLKSDKSLQPEKKLPLLIEGEDINMRRHISIDLEKLQGKATKILEKETSSQRTGKFKHGKTEIQRLVRSAPFEKEQLPKDVIQLAKTMGLLESLSGLKNRSKIGKYYTQYEFLGEVKQTSGKTNDNADSGFRLSVQKPHTMKHDPLVELITRTVEGAEDIRKSIREIERQLKSAPALKKKLQKKKVNADQKLFLKTQGSMGLSYFQAVDKAYRDRRNAEVLVGRMNHVRHIRDVERNCRDRVRRHKKNHQADAAEGKLNERMKILKALEDRRQANNVAFDQLTAKRTANHETRNTARENYKFALEFNCQNASVGKALANHDRMSRKEETTEKKAKKVKEIKSIMAERKGLADDYMGGKKSAMQAETVAMKNKIRTVLAEKELNRRADLFKLLKSRTEKQEKDLRTPALAIKELPPPSV